MSDMHCVFCGLERFQKILKFTSKTRKKCMTVLEYRRRKPVLRQSQTRDLYVNVELTESPFERYHPQCYKLFTAIKIPRDFTAPSFCEDGDYDDPYVPVTSKVQNSTPIKEFPHNKNMRQTWIDIIQKKRSEDNSTVCSEHFKNDVKYTKSAPNGRTRLKSSAAPVLKLKQKKVRPGVSGNNSTANTLDDVRNSLDSNVSKTGPNGPFGIQHLNQCRVCAEFTNNCIAVTDKDRAYLTRNKTELTLNDLSVGLDFNDALPITVCGICDKKLQEMFSFLKQVKEAQDSLISGTDYMKDDIENIIIKTECESPTADDNKVIDSKDGIVDSLTVSETVFVRPTSNYKRKSVQDTPRTQNKDKVTEIVEIEESELIIDVKQDTAEMLYAYEAENSKVQR